jgi:hypothetical protein
MEMTEKEDMELDNFTWDGEGVKLFEEETEESPLSQEEIEQLKLEKDEKSTKKSKSSKKESKEKGRGDDNKDGSDTGSGDGDSGDGDKSEGGDGDEGELEPFSETETEETEEPSTKNKEFFKVLASELKEAGVFANVEIDETQEIDQEKFIELQDAEVEARVDETFEAFFSELDDDAKRFLKFKKEGGDTKQFFELMKRGTERPEGNIEDKKYQENIVRHYLSAYENMSADDIDDRIEWLQSTAKLKKFAQSYEQKINTEEEQLKEAIVKQEEERKNLREQDKVAFIKKLTESLNTVEEVNNIVINKKDKSELLGYITKPAVKIGQNRYITQFQADMKNLTDKHDTLILLAKLVKNNFDLKDLERTIETKKTINIKRKLESTQKGSKTISSGSSNKKSLSDYFND